jgi:hypothetical protein
VDIHFAGVTDIGRRDNGAQARSCPRKVSMEVPLPVAGDLPGRTGSRLAEGVVIGRGEGGAALHLVRPVVVVPVLTWLEARDEPMTCRSSVSTRVLARRRIAASDVTARGTAPEMEPPAIGGQALDAAVAARTYVRLY